jgi:hypothetical protein
LNQHLHLLYVACVHRAPPEFGDLQPAPLLLLAPIVIKTVLVIIFAPDLTIQLFSETEQSLIAKVVYFDLNRLFLLFNFDSIYTTQDPPVKSRFHFSISIGRSFSEIVARSSMNTQ